VTTEKTTKTIFQTSTSSHIVFFNPDYLYSLPRLSMIYNIYHLLYKTLPSSNEICRKHHSASIYPLTFDRNAIIQSMKQHKQK